MKPAATLLALVTCASLAVAASAQEAPQGRDRGAPGKGAGNGAEGEGTLVIGTAGAAGRAAPGGPLRDAFIGVPGRRAVSDTDARIKVRLDREMPATLGRSAKAVRSPSLLEATPSGTPVALGVDVVLEEAIRNGQDMILDRKYDEALALFESIDKSHPRDPLGPLGRMLVYQSQMLENADFALEAEYGKASAEASSRVRQALSRNGNDTWNRLMAGGYHGVIAMHAMRKKKYLAAVDDGWDALSYLRWVERNQPLLADTGLGLGAYDYWRSVITKSVSWLPFFPDRRKAGIAAMERALVDAQYVRPIAQLILVHVYIDEKKHTEAIEFAEDMAARYPNNTLVRVQLGRALSRRARYHDALEVFREVERLQPDNKVVKYYLGANLVYQGHDLDTAETYLRDFIPDAPGKDWRGWAYERLGDLFMKRKQPAVAIGYFRKAKRDNPDDKSLPAKIARAERDARAKK